MSEGRHQIWLCVLGEPRRYTRVRFDNITKAIHFTQQNELGTNNTYKIDWLCGIDFSYQKPPVMIIVFWNVLQVNLSGDATISWSNFLTLSQNTFSSKQPLATLLPYPHPRGTFDHRTRGGKHPRRKIHVCLYCFLKRSQNAPVKPPCYPTQVAIPIPCKTTISMYSR